MAKSTRGVLRLESAQVTNFGCFADSGEVPIDSVTALIAENENGKTTFLRALAWWDNGDVDFDEEDRWEGADPAATLDVVALTFTVGKPASDALKETGITPQPTKVRIIRDTNGDYRVENADTGEVLEIDSPLEFATRRDALVESLRTLTSVAEAAEVADELAGAQAGEASAETVIAKLREHVLPALASPELETTEALVTKLEEAIANPGKRSGPDTIDLLEPFLPNLIYFDERIDFVQDSVTYDEVSANPEAHRTMVNLAAVAGVDLVAIAKSTPHQRQRSSQSAQKMLSSEFSKYWHGDPVTVFTQFDETQMTLTIEHRGRNQRPSRRSSGLKWQLGFFVNFTAEVKGPLSGAVLLLDEPGLHLHIKQQPKLLELFDDLASAGCRIIYATHLSHMLAPDKPHTFRPLIADPSKENATTIVPNIMAVPSRSDVMQPVRQALGMGIADAIGFGGNTVVAEGWAERYVLLAMDERCRNASAHALQTTVTILPAGGSGKKILPFAAMAVAEKSNAVVLVDDDKAGRDTVSLIQKTLPGAVEVVRTHDETDPTNLELEDLFSASDYVDLVNKSHKGVKGFKAIEVQDIDTSKPICDAVAARFTAMKLGKFQKLRPAMELQKRVEAGQSLSDESVQAFANLFERLNAALSKG